MISIKDANPNYVAHFVVVDKVEAHPNADRLKLVTVQNCVVIAGLDAKEGDEYVYIPVEAELSDKFLSWSNSYEKPEKNANPNVKGYFSSRRVRMVKLRGVYSNGYIFQFSVFKQFVKEVYGKSVSFENGRCFNMVCDELFVNKYELPVKEEQTPGQKTKGKIRKFVRVIPGQFAFHPDTKNLRHEIQAELSPEDYIAIGDKMHGSNFVVANTLVYKKLNWWQKLLKLIGVDVLDRQYGMIYSSRTVVKNKSLNPESGEGWYGEDIWGIVAERVFPKLDKGVRVSGEIVGWTPTGKMIQPGYDYGIPQNQLDFVIFKVDITNADGETFTMSHPQIVEYCFRKGFRTPDYFYYGLAKDLFPDLDVKNRWHSNFLQKLEQTFLNQKELRNIDKNLNKEGIVVSIQKPLSWKVFKLKDLTFLGYETHILDNGHRDIDSVENSM